MAAVINGGAALGWIVDSTEILPLAGTHLRAGMGAAGWSVGKEGDNDGVGLLDQEAAELIQPDLARCVGRWPSELTCQVDVDRDHGILVWRVGAGGV